MPTPSDTANRGSTLAVLVFIPHRQTPIEDLYSSLAQSVEHLTVNQGVVGSSPTGGAKTEKVTQSVAFFVLFFSIEFEQRLLILNRQQPEGRLTATFAPRSLRRGQTCTPVRSVAEAGGLLQGVVGSSPTGGASTFSS